MKEAIYIVDDNAGYRQVLTAMLAHSGLPIFEFDDPEDFLKFANIGDRISQISGCLIVDVRFRGSSGFDLQNVLRCGGCQLPIIVVTAHGDVKMAIRAMKGGAADFLLKNTDNQSFVDSVNEALARDRQWRATRSQQSNVRQNFETLDAREKQILAEIVKGRLNKQIAADVGLSEVTVKVYRSRIMTKMQVKNVADLIRAAIRLEDFEEGVRGTRHDFTKATPVSGPPKRPNGQHVQRGRVLYAVRDDDYR